jgi:hypothetical protein
VSLAGVVRDGDRIPDHPVVSQLVRDRRVPRDLVALHRGDLVLVRDLEVDTVELYDLARDPAQEDELGDVPAAHDLRRELDRLADTDLSPLPARMP